LLLPQLGVNINDPYAISNGALANNYLFFGSATAETVARAALAGGWHGQAVYTPHETQPWYTRGGEAANTPGVFTFTRRTGGVYASLGHRTILSGY
jgi:hypothetical protein